MNDVKDSVELGHNGRLVSWKRIARYLDRSERTVRRWEKEAGLPVQRLVCGRASTVYGDVHEIDDWLSEHTANPVEKKGPSDQRTIMVRPLSDLSHNQDQRFLCLGLAEELTSRLHLTARHVATVLMWKPPTPNEIAVAESDFVLSGCVRSEPDRVKINLRLVRSRDDCLLAMFEATHQSHDFINVEERIADDATPNFVAALSDAER